MAADLSKNGIGVKGISAVTEALSHNDALQTLVLDTNSIGDEGAEVLAKHLTGGHTPFPPEQFGKRSDRLNARSAFEASHWTTEWLKDSRAVCNR